MADLLRQTPVQYELKRENRFVLEFPTSLGIEAWLVQASGRPKININSVEIPFINTKFYVAGQYSWDPITIEFIDPIGPSTSQKVMEWVRLHAESVTGRMGYAAGYMQDLVLKALDPTGVEIEKWTLRNCMITSAEFGNNAMDSDALQKVTVTVQPQFCIHNY